MKIDFLSDSKLQLKWLQRFNLAMLFIAALSFIGVEKLNEDIAFRLEIVGSVAGALLIIGFIVQKNISKKNER